MGAEFAGDEAFQTQLRVFGHVYISSSPESPRIAETFVNGITEATGPRGDPTHLPQPRRLTTPDRSMRRGPGSGS